MFYTKSKDQEIKKKISLANQVLKEEIDILALRVNSLSKSVQTLLQMQNSSVTVTLREDAPYGLKKDGTPKARPGRRKVEL
mgnify:FL=1